MRWDKLLLIPLSINHESQLITDEILWDIEMKDPSQIKSFAFNWLLEIFYMIILKKHKKSQKEKKVRVFFKKPCKLPLSKTLFEKQITPQTHQ